MGVDLLPGVGASATEAPNTVRELSINVLGGISGAVEGVEVAGIFSIDRAHVEGIQAAGVFNLVGGSLDGVEVAGVANVVRGDVEGIQGAGVVNIAGGRLNGVQASGSWNAAFGGMDGIQVSVVNLATDPDGFQAGMANLALGRLKGVQIGVANVATGSQEGLQVGVVNYAREAKGFSLGIVNIFPEGRTHLDLWTDETGMANLALKHGGEGFHYIYGIGASPRVLSAQVGLGDHTRLSRALFWDTEIVAKGLLLPDALQAMNVGGQVRTRLGLQIFPGLALFAGPSYSVLATNCDPPEWAFVRTFHERDGLGVHGWPGVDAGIQLLRP
jgi:hypothetical protein